MSSNNFHSSPVEEYESDNLFRVLTLDGGGAKGFYTLGVLKEIEAMLGCPLYKRFDLVFGTSTGAVIAVLIALGYKVDHIHDLYDEHVPRVMSKRSASGRTAALQKLANEVFQDRTFDDVLTGIGIVTTRWLTEKPMIFKGNIGQAHGRKGTFTPGFGVSIADAVQASCSAYPFFERKVVVTDSGDKVELIDGGYCANNPTLFAIADATAALSEDRDNIRVVNVGVGIYPEPKQSLIKRFFKKWTAVQLLQKTLEINTQSMDQLRNILFNDIPTVRISDTFERPEMATDLLEHDLEKLNILRQRGSESFAAYEETLAKFLL
ncbi:MAG: patatin-like phospholipase family protein [Sneathiella sp.]|nr:patatin-like phospholipase family protein [Sneathiella sp.]